MSARTWSHGWRRDVRRTRRRVPRWVAALAAFGTASTGCGSSNEAFDVIRGLQDDGSFEVVRTLPELIADADEIGIVVVDGTVVRIDDGVGMAWTFDEDGTERLHVLDFDDPNAEVHTVHVGLRVEHVIAGAVEGSEIRFGLIAPEPGDASTLRDGLDGNRYVAVLTPSPVFDHEPDLLGVVADGGLLCLRDGPALVCPGLDDGLRSAFAVDRVVIDELP